MVLRVFYLIMKECLLGVYFVLGKWMDWFLKWYRGCSIGKWWWYDFSSGFGDFGWWGAFLSGFGGFLLEGSFFPVVFGFFDGKKFLRSKPPLVYIYQLVFSTTWKNEKDHTWDNENGILEIHDLKLSICGDLTIACYEGDTKDTLLSYWIHTAFINKGDSVVNIPVWTINDL